MIQAKESRTLMARTISFCPYMGEVFGICGALMIQQIHYYCCESKNVKEGHKWVYNTYTEWSTQLRVYEERSIRTTMASLRAQGIIVTGTFNTKKYDKTLWYRVDYEKLLAVLSAHFPNRHFLPIATGKIFRIDMAEISTPIPKITTETTTKTSLATPKTTTGSVESNTSEGSNVTPKFNIIKTKKVPTTAADIVAKGLKPKAADLKDVKAGNMALIWKQTVPEFNPSVVFVPDFTMKQKGQLVQLVKRWGDANAGKVLQYVLSNWLKFAKFAASQTGTKSFPEAPSVDYLTKYSAEALNLYYQKHEESSPKLAGATNCTDPKIGVTEKIGKLIIKKATAKVVAPPCTEANPPPIKEQIADVNDQKGTLDEILDDPFFAKYNKTWLEKK